MKFTIFVCKFSPKKVQGKCTVSKEANGFLPLCAMVERGTCGFTFVNRTQQRVRGLVFFQRGVNITPPAVNYSAAECPTNIIHIVREGQFKSQF